MGGPKKEKKTTLSESEWIERFTKKEEKKHTYDDPNATFKPKISKNTEKIIQSKGQRNTLESLMDDSKKRIEKDKQ